MKSELLFIHRGALGDFVLCFPLLEALGRAGYGRHLVTRREHGDLANALGLSEGWLDCESGTGYDLLTQKEEAFHYLEDKIKGLSLILALVSDPDKKFQRWLSKVTRLPHHVLFPRPDEKFKGHVSDYPFIELEKLQLGRTMETHDYWQGGPLFLMHPGSGSPSKNFPNSFFTGLKERLLVVNNAFILGPAEHERTHRWPGKVITPESLIILAEELIHCRALISHDTGVAHLAAWLGVPTLALFKTTEPRLWAPQGKRAGFLTGPDLNVDTVYPEVLKLLSHKPYYEHESLK
ncbi:MAG: glycosyltransferase family 9 protein [Fibrobacterota bacterium]